MKRSRSNASRRRSRRPKFMSLRDQITAAEDEQKGESSSAEDEGNIDVAHRFFTGEEGCATTLTGLLREETEEESSPMSSVSAAYGVDGKSLVKAAMRRSREREEEVRWVRMSEVVSEEVTRWLGRWRDGGAGAGGGGLALKLDYKEVEEAWDGCGKGRPVFAWPAPESASTAAIEGAQVVPDLRLHDEFFYHHDLNAANGVLWGVPDPISCILQGVEGNGDHQSVEGWRLGQREASVLRYKEKRMNRLFSKRIRYEVRKLNAEKRPRVKGRFVKRS